MSTDKLQRDTSTAEDAMKAALQPFAYERDRLAAELAEGYGYLRRLFERLAPQCEPFDQLPGLATQIDNYIAGLNEQLAAARAEVERLQDRCTQICDALANGHHEHAFELADEIRLEAFEQRGESALDNALDLVPDECLALAPAEETEK